MVTPRQIPQPYEKDFPPHTISHQEFPSEGGIPTPTPPLPPPPPPSTPLTLFGKPCLVYKLQSIMHPKQILEKINSPSVLDEEN